MELKLWKKGKKGYILKQWVLYNQALELGHRWFYIPEAIRIDNMIIGNYKNLEYKELNELLEIINICTKNTT